MKLLFIWKAALPNGLFPPRCFPRPEKGSEEQALEIWVQVAQPYLPPSSQRAGAAQRAMSLTSAKEGADCRVRDGGRACPRSPLVLLWGGALTGCTPPGQPSVPGLFLHLRPQQSGLRLLPSPCASPGRLLPRNLPQDTDKAAFQSSVQATAGGLGWSARVLRAVRQSRLVGKAQTEQGPPPQPRETLPLRAHGANMVPRAGQLASLSPGRRREGRVGLRGSDL